MRWYLCLSVSYELVMMDTDILRENGQFGALGGSVANEVACFAVVFFEGEVLHCLVSDDGTAKRSIHTLMCHWITAMRWIGAILY